MDRSGYRKKEKANKKHSQPGEGTSWDCSEYKKKVSQQGTYFLERQISGLVRI